MTLPRPTSEEIGAIAISKAKIDLINTPSPAERPKLHAFHNQATCEHDFRPVTGGYRMCLKPRCGMFEHQYWSPTL